MRHLIFAFFLAIAPVAHAVVITQTLTRTGPTDEYYSGSPLGTFGGSFQQFDPALGTLDAVNLNIDGDLIYSADYRLEPSSCVGGCYSEVAFSTGYIFNGPGFPPASETATDFFASLGWHEFVSLDPTSGLYQYQDSWHVTPCSSCDTQSYSTETTSAVLHASSSGPLSFYYRGSPDSVDDYIGLGNVSINGAISEDSDICANTGIAPMCSDNLDLTTTLQYSYTPSVTEPPQLLIFVIGLMALGWLAHRHRKRQF
ncbi:hypothetical protein V5738_09490 [Salinisphaera sp. SPP-AMP-43]|uniref:hypothetical protein n=1 Tax=Salinisphaera sp. SPP-AMP-43 TaxID=3121288 RepID=UPI003C6DEC4B